MDTNQLQLENEKLNARLEKAKEVFRQQAVDIKTKDEAYSKLKDEYDAFIKERDTFAQDNVKLNEQISELEVQKQCITELQNKTAITLKMRDDEIEELKKTIAKFEEGNSKHDELQEELNTTKKELHTANETINEYASKCVRYDDVIKSFKEKVKELQDTYNNLVIERDSDVQSLNHTIEQLKKDIEDKDAQLTDACTKVSNLTKQLETESGKVEEVKTKTEVAVTSIKKKLQALNDGLGNEFNIFG